MAIYVVQNAAPNNIDNQSMFQAGATLTSFSATALNYTNPSGTRVVVTGSAFTVSGSVPTSGTVTQISVYDPTWTTLYTDLTGLSVSVNAFYNAWFGAGGGGGPVWSLLMAGDDSLAGGTANDTLQGVTGNDTLIGGAGNDYIDPHKGTDVIDGGPGNDMLSYSWGNFDSAITAGITVDLNGTTVIDPWGFTDTFTSIEQVRATRFADTLIGNAVDNWFQGLAGNDTLNGGGGFDGADYYRDTSYGGTAAVNVDLRNGTAIDGFGNTDKLIGIENAKGTTKGDTFQGGDTILPNGNLWAIYGMEGNDTIISGAGGVYAEPGAGDDVITGSSNPNDQISYGEYSGANAITLNLGSGSVNDPYGGVDTFTSIEGARLTKNNDTFIGDNQNNYVRGLAGNDTLNGGGGLDRAMYDRDVNYGGAAGVNINLATGIAIDGFGNTDTLISIERARGTEVNDIWRGGNIALSGADVYEFQALGGNDSIQGGTWGIYVEPGAGNDTIVGGTGTDQVSYAEYVGPNGAVFNYVSGVIKDPYGGTDLVSQVEGMRGTSNADWFRGDGGFNFARGLAGNDTLDGGAGITDEVRYDRDFQYGGNGGVTVDLVTGVATDGFGDTDTLLRFEYVSGSNSDDTIYGNGAANRLWGMRGADLLDGRGGFDTADYSRDDWFGGNYGVSVDLKGGKARDGFNTLDTLVSIENVIGTNHVNMDFINYSDVIFGSNAANRVEARGGDDLVHGMSGDDTLLGEDGNDTLFGDAGNDTMVGGTGNDILTGGLGIDTFVFNLSDLVVDQHDLIADLELGIDWIVLPLAVQASTTFNPYSISVAVASGQYELTVIGGYSGADLQSATKFV